MTAPQGSGDLAWECKEGGIGQSGAPNGLGRWGIRHLGWVYGLEMVNFAYLDFLVIADGPGKAGSQWHFFTLEGCSLPLAAAAGWGIAACVRPLCLADRVLECHMFSSLPLATRGVGSATWSILWVAAKFRT